MGAHGLQDAVKGLRDGGFEVTGMDLSGLEVLLKGLVGGVLHRALRAREKKKKKKSYGYKSNCNITDVKGQ